jgi:hypothetical protein
MNINLDAFPPEVISTNTPFCNPDIANWVRSGDTDIREIIIEVNLPQRRVVIRRSEYGPMVLDHIESSFTPEDRACLLGDLNNFLSKQMHLTTTILKTAGAIAVQASGKDVQRILAHPMVKAIRPNRKVGHNV